MQIYAKYMHKICTKYAKKYARNMQKYARNMQTYASTCRAVSAAEICKKCATYTQCICKNMQNMPSRFAYAKYAKNMHPPLC